MEISIENQQKKITLNLFQIKRITKAILKHEGVADATVSLVFVTSQKIKALNKKFLNRTYVTDVLAFDLKDDVNPTQPQQPLTLNGEIIISTDAVKQNAKQYETTWAYELVLYVAHGLLHLLGYDDHDPDDIAAMRAKEQEIMTDLGRRIHNVINQDEK